MRIVKKLFLIILLFVFGLPSYMYLETRWIRTNTVEIKSPDLPPSFENKKIVYVSDIHHGPYLSKRRVRKLVSRINKLSPEIILLGGDYVQRNPKYIEPFFDEIKNLNAGMGIYGVLGNHDHWEDAELTRELMTKYGFKICDNESYWAQINSDSIKIGGVGDLWEDVQILENTVHDVGPKDFCVLISHNPDYFEDMDPGLIDLAVAGHTHGGQVTYFGNRAPVLPIRYGERYRYGLKAKENAFLYITSGIGTVTPPIRFFCRPEIVVFNLVKESL